MTNFGTNLAHPVVNSDESVQNRELAHPLRGARERELLQVALFHVVLIVCHFLLSITNFSVNRLSINLVMLMKY